MEERFEDFRRSYQAELEQNPAVEQLLELAAAEKRVTLLYAPGTLKSITPASCWSSCWAPGRRTYDYA
ncbi:uroporphyrin-Iii C-methyltransferase, partial [Arthrobacter sp. Hiyo1]